MRNRLSLRLAATYIGYRDRMEAVVTSQLFWVGTDLVACCWKRAPGGSRPAKRPGYLFEPRPYNPVVLRPALWQRLTALWRASGNYPDPPRPL